MARTVTDARSRSACSSAPDPRDPATADSAGRFFRDYTRFLHPQALEGARIGVPRRGFWGFDDVTDAVTERALEVLRDAGATLVDKPFPSIDAIMASDAELTVLLYEFKQDVADYLQSLPRRPGCPRSLRDLIEFNRDHRAQELQYFGQELFLLAQDTDGLDSPTYRRALAGRAGWGGARGSTRCCAGTTCRRSSPRPWVRPDGSTSTAARTSRVASPPPSSPSAATRRSPCRWARWRACP